MRPNSSFARTIHDSSHSFWRAMMAVLLVCVWTAMLGCGGGGNGGGGNGGNGGGNGTPSFSVAVVTQGNFSSGQQGASYKITVTNTGNFGTDGTVTVAGAPTGFTVTAMAGTNWSCTVATATCTSSQLVVQGQSFPAIVVTGNVTASNGTPVSINLQVSGGGAAAVNSNATVTVAAVALAIAKTHTGNFSAGQQGATYTVTVQNGASAGATSGKVTVTETVPSGETLVSMVGTGWTCPGSGGASTCDRSDTLITGASYPAITVTVNVAGSATSPQVNQVSVSGGGMASSASATDSTTINPPPVGPDAAIVASHAGYFGAGTDGVLTLAVSNVGTGPTTGTITVTDTLAAQLTYVSGTATGWTCGAAGQVVTCTNAGPLAAGASAATIPLVVAVAATASITVQNTASVATAGDTDAANNSSTDSITLVPTLPESINVGIPGVAAGSVIYAGGNMEAIAITVTNEGAGDVLSPALTQNGVACTTCGTLGPLVGTSSPYGLSYTPPASVTAATVVTLTVSSTIAGSFAGTANFTIYPAGAVVVRLTGVGSGSGTRSNLAAYVYNDTSSLGANVELLAAGYACPGTVCGTLTVGAVTSGTTNVGMGTAGIAYTKTAFTYTPPTSAANSPYDRPMIFASAKVDSTKTTDVNFITEPGAANGVNGFLIGLPSRLVTALTGATPITLGAGIGNDTGVNKTVVWSLTDATGANCQPACGTLGTPAYTWNGPMVNASITYTAPATLPAGAADEPILTMVPLDPINNAQEADSVQFQINDGTCGTGNNSVLNGEYAFLLQGGGQNAGYLTLIGSFGADGNGNITGGTFDANSSTGPSTVTSIVAAGSSYSIGADGRGCLTLANSNGGAAVYRIAVGTLDGSNHATEGSMLRFTDNTGVGPRTQGVLMKQDTTAFGTAISGTYVFGYQGVTGLGARLAADGVYQADGAGNLTSLDTDSADSSGNLDTNDTSGSGTYSTTVDASTGRGTATFRGTGSVFYIVSASEMLSMTTDPISATTPILSGDNRKQTLPSGGLTQTSLDGNSYVLYETAVDPSSGGNATLASQVVFSTNGANTGIQETNVNGTVSEKATSGSLTIAANGRAASSDGSLVLYLIGTSSAFLVDADVAGAGHAQQQSAGPFSNASLSGQAFFGGGAPTPGTTYDSGSANFDGAGGLTVNLDEQDPEGGVGSSTQALSYAIDATTGKLTITQQSTMIAVGFIVSGSQVVFISAGAGSGPPELFLGQK